jgi:hypothetical protein
MMESNTVYLITCADNNIILRLTLANRFDALRPAAHWLQRALSSQRRLAKVR